MQERNGETVKATENSQEIDCREKEKQNVMNFE